MEPEPIDRLVRSRHTRWILLFFFLFQRRPRSAHSFGEHIFPLPPLHFEVWLSLRWASATTTASQVWRWRCLSCCSWPKSLDLIAAKLSH